MTARVVKTEALHRLGWDNSAIKAALEAGILLRVARGWVAHPSAEAWIVHAIEHGGRLGCLSGCKIHGLWTPNHREPHVITHRGAKHAGRSWHRHPAPLPDEAVFPLMDCLAQAIRHHSAEEALTVLESAVNLRKITATAAQLLIADSSGRKQQALRFFDPSAESGSETRVRLWLQQQRFPVQSQVQIPGVGRVDFLVGHSLIIECDSQEHHRHNDADYQRDLIARALGYTPVRITYQQIFHQWEETSEFLQRQLRTGQHLRKPRPH